MKILRFLKKIKSLNLILTNFPFTSILLRPRNNLAAAGSCKTWFYLFPVLNAHRTRRRCTGGYLGPMPSTPPSLPATRQTSVPKRTSTTFYSSGWRARKTTRCGHALFKVFFTRQHVCIDMITVQIERDQRSLHLR